MDAEKLTFSVSIANGTGFVLGDGYEVVADEFTANLCLGMRGDFLNKMHYHVYDFAVGEDLTIMGGKCVRKFDAFYHTAYVCCEINKSGLYYPIAREPSNKQKIQLPQRRLGGSRNFM